MALGAAVTATPEPSVSLTLVQAVPKGDAIDQIVRDVVMMGVAAVVPLVSDRAEVKVERLQASGRAARWQRIAVSSVKQCGRAVVPVVHAPGHWRHVSRNSRPNARIFWPSPALWRARPRVFATSRPHRRLARPCSLSDPRGDGPRPRRPFPNGRDVPAHAGTAHASRRYRRPGRHHRAAVCVGGSGLVGRVFRPAARRP